MAIVKPIHCEFESNNQLIAKVVITDFWFWSHVVVNETQEALFVKNGQALELFGAGQHPLDTDHFPILRQIFGALFRTNVAFPCDVYFINKASVLEMPWGTDSPVVVEDPKYHLIVNVRANGQTGLHVADSRLFVTKLVGQLSEFTTETVRRAIKAMLLSAIKETIAQTIVDEGISILEITTRLSSLSAVMTERINARLADIGLALDHFAINAILGDECDLKKLREVKEKRLDAMNEAEVEAERMRLLSEARARARAMEGYTYQDERRFDVLETAAKNEGSVGGMAGLGIGVGVGTGLGREFGTMTAAAATPAPQAAAVCTKCGAPLASGARFCSACGAPAEQGPKFCPGCGSRCPDGGRFCPSCGQKL